VAGVGGSAALSAELPATTRRETTKLENRRFFLMSVGPSACGSQAQ
jgi:hypothetical protein